MGRCARPQGFEVVAVLGLRHTALEERAALPMFETLGKNFCCPFLKKALSN
jgi:hypothetical protein